MTRRIYQMSSELLPNGTSPLESQVAGHTFTPDMNSVGLLKVARDATILKPVGKPECGAREILFYESIKEATEMNIAVLRNFVPQYFGTVKMVLNNRELEFIKLEDLTFGMNEPCIMDIKIGKRTWDPLATPEKRKAEEQKYAACKEALGFCVPGFQVYNLLTGKLQRFGKDYGKALNESTFNEALKFYLNFETSCCRFLISEILRQLKSIQNWSRTQCWVKLYSSSILLIYDAKGLQNYCEESGNHCNNFNKLVFFQVDNTPSNIAKKVDMSFSSGNQTPTDIDEERRSTQDNRFSKENNCVKGSKENASWVRVKMIDFAHAFFPDDNCVDTNYLFGIENLIQIFERLLEESQ